RHRISTVLKTFDAIPFALAMIVVAIFPIFYCEGATWWLPLVFLPITLALALHAIQGWWLGGRYSRMRISTCMALLVIPLVLCVVQLIPNAELLKAIAPANLGFWEMFNSVALSKGETTISLSPDNTIWRGMTYLACLLLFFLIINCVHSHGRIKFLLLAIMLAALGNSFLAFIDFFCGDAKGIGDEFRGAFLNRNHFAFLMMMGTVASATLLSIVTVEHTLRREETTSVWIRMIPLYIFAVFMLMTSQILSLSRGAFVGSSIALILYGVIWFSRSKTVSRTSRQKFLAIVLLVGVALANALPIAMAKLAERYEQLNESDVTMDKRWLIWQDSFNMLRDYWMMGVGQGAFGDSIQRYESGNISNRLIDHAHNDFVELACEIGVPAMVFLVILGVVLWIFAMRRIWKSEDYVNRWAGTGMLIAVLGVSFHELFDFNLQAWCNATVFTAILSIIAICSRKRTRISQSANSDSQAGGSSTAQSAVSSSSQSEASSSTESSRHRIARLPYLLVAAVLLALLPYEMDIFLGAIARTKLIKEMQVKYHGANLTKYDFERRNTLVEKSLGCFGSRTFYHRRKAMIAMEYADQYGDDQFERIAEALDHVSIAASLMPGNGSLAMLCARYAKEARNLAVAKFDDEKVIALYEWACRCYPTLTRTQEETAFAAYERFLNTSDEEVELSKRYLDEAVAKLTKVLAFENCNRREIFRALFFLLDDPLELVKLIPDNFKSMMMLAHLYVDLSYSEGAVKTIDLISAKHDDGTLELTDKELMSVYDFQTFIYELTGDQTKRKIAWDKYWNMQQSANVVERVGNALERGKLRAAETALKTSRGNTCSNAQLILFEAEMYSRLGRQLDMVVSLIPLVYGYSVNLEDGHLVRAMELLKAVKKLDDSEYQRRFVFLKSALQIMMAERGGASSDVSAATGTLQAMSENDNNGSGGRKWLQWHLIPLYAARGAMLLGKQDEAIKLLRKCLESCPMNRLAMDLLHDIAPGELTPEEQGMHAIIHERTCPIARFHNGLIWLAVKTEPEVLTHLYEQQKTTYYMECVDDITEMVQQSMTILNNNRPCFKDAIVFPNGKEFTLRVGEIATISREWQTASKCTTTIKTALSNGTLGVKAQTKNVQPTAMAIYGTVDIK
ncbi:MAG: O-antigen ligase family protein, partial [Victivallales bacterium]|nr:O-antigen ligase family protein [Victivallales bacterium]